MPCKRLAALGRRARMFAAMIKETPLPMPRSVICSPSHTSSMVPAVIMITDWTINQSVVFNQNQRCRVLRMQPAIGKIDTLADTEKNRQITSILDDFGAAILFTRQLAQARPDRGQQLNDDRRADIRHDAQRGNRATVGSATRKGIVQAEHAARALRLRQNWPPTRCRQCREDEQTPAPAPPPANPA